MAAKVVVIVVQAQVQAQGTGFVDWGAVQAPAVQEHLLTTATMWEQGEDSGGAARALTSTTEAFMALEASPTEMYGLRLREEAAAVELVG